MSKPGKIVYIIVLVLTGAVSTFFIKHFFEYVRQRKIRKIHTDQPALIVSQLSLEQKVGQLIHTGISGKKIGPGIRTEIKKRYTGGLIFFATNLGSPEKIRSLTEALQEVSNSVSGIPLFISTDQEGGRVIRVDNFGVDQFPGAMAIGQSNNKEYAEDIGFITGYRLNQLGINLVLAPVLDVNNNPDNPVINTRSFGSDHERVSSMGLALAAGIRKANSIPVIKHFPGHGDTNIDSHLALPRINKSLKQLEMRELKPFKRAIENGAEAVMSAHILFPVLDPKYPATLSSAILNKLLRKKLGFNGLIMTDAMEMKAISSKYSLTRAARLSILAGADVILLTAPGSPSREIFNSLLKGFRNGELPIEILNRAVERQIELKLRKGLFQRYKSSLVEVPILEKNYKITQIEIRRQYLMIRNKYKNKGNSLNTHVSRDSIASLRKIYSGTGQVPRENTHLFSNRKIMQQEAASMGLNPENIHNSSGPVTVFNRLKNAGNNKVIYLVNIGIRQTGQWNRLVREVEKRPEHRKTILVGLFSGDPFKKIQIPMSGAVLASFSPTAESVRALVHRALDGKPVRKARLTFSKKPK